MHRRIAIIQGHPDINEDHLGHALARTYRISAEAAGHLVREVIVAQLDVPMLQSKAEWDTGQVPDSVRAAQEAIQWAEHLVFIHPLWLGSMPASFKAFLEQVFRPGFAIDTAPGRWKKLLSGRSARVIVTMQMPAALYRFYFFSHGLRSMVRNVLKLSAIAPVRTTLIGRVEDKKNFDASRWMRHMTRLGHQAK